MTGLTRAARARSAQLAARYRALGYGPETGIATRAAMVLKMRAEGVSARDCAEVFGVSPELIRNIMRGLTQMQVTGEERRLVQDYRAWKRAAPDGAVAKWRFREVRGSGAGGVEDADQVHQGWRDHRRA